MNQHTALVLEGGGMRGVYTAGVLDYFMDEGLDFPLVSTSSSGAVIASSYVANQRDRNYRILDAIVRNREFISWKRLLQGKALFDMDFIFDEVPNRVVKPKASRMSCSVSLNSRRLKPGDEPFVGRMFGNVF